jgi:hypothetical protein
MATCRRASFPGRRCDPIRVGLRSSEALLVRILFPGHELVGPELRMDAQCVIHSIGVYGDIILSL